MRKELLTAGKKADEGNKSLYYISDTIFSNF